ncbi:rod shape-determining protein RodA [Patescibacteria group bacterium]
MKKPALIDWHLIIPSLFILAFGLTSLLSINSATALTQLFFLAIGTFFFIFFSNFNYQDHQSLIKIYALGCLFLLILPFIFSTATRGSVRWIQIGSFTLQPSEIIKPFIILIFANFLSNQKTPNMLQYFLLLLLPVFLIFKQPDLGSTLVIGAIWLGILIASKIPLLKLLSLAALTILVSPLVFKLLKPYQQQRISTFLNPYQDPKGSGYQVIQSTIAVGSGRFLGKGLGQGTQSQLQFLPERETDFIFASISEELGFLGAAALIITYFFLLKRILKISQSTPDKFSYLTAIGIFSMIFFQAFINIAMNLGLMPVTGITLPLVSAGGSSLIATLISLGIVHNIYQHSSERKSLVIK